MFIKKRKINKRNKGFGARRMILVVCVLLVVFFVSLYAYTKHSKRQIAPGFKVENISENTKNSQVNALKSLLQQNHIGFAKIVESGATCTIYLPDGSQVLFSTQKDLLMQISSLQYILSRLTMEGRPFRKLDERFDNPVIIFR